jgi:hypothetical protein
MLKFKRLRYHFYLKDLPFSLFCNSHSELQHFEAVFNSLLNTTAAKVFQEYDFQFIFTRSSSFLTSLRKRFATIFLYDYDPLDKFEMINDIFSELRIYLGNELLSDIGEDQMTPTIQIFLYTSQFPKQFSNYYYLCDFLPNFHNNQGWLIHLNRINAEDRFRHDFHSLVQKTIPVAVPEPTTTQSIEILQKSFPYYIPKVPFYYLFLDAKFEPLQYFKVQVKFLQSRSSIDKNENVVLVNDISKLPDSIKSASKDGRFNLEDPEILW